MSRRGFTLIEMLSALLIMGILAALALPGYQDVRRRAMAVRVITDYHAIRVGAREHYAEYGEYPASAGWGRVPQGMGRSLPHGFQFSYGDLQYRWRRWSFPDGTPRNSRQTNVLGLEVRGGDDALLQTIRNQFKGTEVGNKQRLTMLIE